MIRVSHRASFSYMLRHPWQLMLALLGIGIGVAVIVAVDLANASARKAFLLSMDKVTGEATHQVVGGPRGVDEAVYAKLRVEHGLRAIAPVVSGAVEVNDTLLDVLGADHIAYAVREVPAAGVSVVGARPFSWGSVSPIRCSPSPASASSCTSPRATPAVTWIGE